MPKFAAVVAPPDLKLCNPYFLISEPNVRNASMNNSLIRVYESGTSPFRNSKRSLHLVKFLNINSSEFSEIFAHNKYFSNFFNWTQVVTHSGYDNCISVAIYVSFTFRNKNRHITRFENNIAPLNI